jgi:hypothetical protein
VHAAAPFCRALTTPYSGDPFDTEFIDFKGWAADLGFDDIDNLDFE